MNIHHSHLAAEPFDAIASGNKTIESRLYDDKRQTIQLGDEIEYINRANDEQTVKVKVIALHKYQNFHELFVHNDIAKFGGGDLEQLETKINEFYNIDDQNKYGVVGIEFELV